MEDLTDLFKTFEDRGEKTAFVHRTNSRRFVYSYSRLSELSIRMAEWLGRNGIEKGDRVTIWAPNSPWWAISFWGCVLRGVIVVPVDFSSGKERAETIVSLTESKLIIQSRYKAERIGSVKNVLIEDLEYEIPPTKPEFSKKDRVKTKKGDIAEIIYTSGTTGDPKGVVLTHKNIITNLLQVNQRIALKPEYRFLSLLPLSHMFEQIGDFLSPLHRGSLIVYLDTLKPSAIVNALKKERISVIVTVPRFLQVLKNSIERELETKHLLKVFLGLTAVSKHFPLFAKRIIFFPVRRAFDRRFAFFVSGGAALETELAEFWSQLGFKVIEGYGITECSPVLAVNDERKQVFGSVGPAIPGVDLKVEDNEILAKGDNVFPGYFENEAATREAFTEDGWFKTGDLGFFDGEKNLHIKGRKKEVIITSAGINIYPDDIEPVLNRIKGVKESCVIGLAREEGEEVHAVLILDGSGRAAEKIVLEANGRLDPLQQISRFTVWPGREFPKTNTLKIQRFKVRERIVAPADGKQGKDSSDKLIYIVSQVTGTAPGKIKETSLLSGDLGLNSIARLELANCLEREFRMDVEDTIIDQRMTVGDLRKFVESRGKTSFRYRLRPWTNTAIVRWFRRCADLVLNERIFRYLAKTETTGIENLQGNREPVLFAANHISYFDTSAIYYALPKDKRYRVSVAAGDDFFFNGNGGILGKILRRIMYEYSSLCFNAFILPEKAGFRRIMEHMGTLIERGVSLLYFPEGGLTRNGVPLPFQPGIGLIVKELRVPVVPIKLEGLESIIAPDTALIRRGTVKVKFGKPICFTRESPAEITKKIRAAIYDL
jgi:long-chain acyl-CoA synthetase